MNSIIFLGSGSSQGVPMIGCKCEVCRSSDPRDMRLRSSVLISIENKADIIIDSSMDFRYQMLRENISSIDAILFTHGHKDHTGGLDDVRAFNYFLKKSVDIYAEDIVKRVLEKDYDYAFGNKQFLGIPEIEIHTISTDEFVINGVKIVPVRGWHYKLPVLGFKIENICYMTDINRVDPEEIEKIKGVDILVVNALRHEPHISHYSLNEALELIKIVGPKEAYLTHVSHQMGRYIDIEPTLPENVHLAYDRLKIKL